LALIGNFGQKSDGFLALLKVDKNRVNTNFKKNASILDYFVNDTGQRGRSHP